MTFEKKKLFIFVILLFSLLVLINQFSISHYIKNSFFLIPRPFCIFLEKIGSDIEEIPVYFSKENKLIKENNKLSRQINILLSENERLKYFEKQNQDLKKLLSIDNSGKYQYILAQVIIRKTSDSSLYINKGSNSEVSEGMVAISPDHILLGKVKEVFKNYAVISLVTHEDNVFDVEISNNVYGVARGKGLLKIAVNNISQEKEVKKGDLAFTSPYSEIYPPSLLVGRVSDIEKNDVDPFQKITLVPLFNINKLRNIFLIK